MSWLSATQGEYESALPGEWAALVLAVTLVGLLGGLILAVTCVRHERMVTRRVRARRGAAAGPGAGADRRFRR